MLILYIADWSGGRGRDGDLAVRAILPRGLDPTRFQHPVWNTVTPHDSEDTGVAKRTVAFPG